MREVVVDGGAVKQAVIEPQEDIRERFGRDGIHQGGLTVHDGVGGSMQDTSWPKTSIQSEK